MVERRPKKTAVYHISKHLVQAGARGWKALEVMSSPKKEKIYRDFVIYLMIMRGILQI